LGPIESGVYGCGVPSLIGGYFFRVASNSPLIFSIGHWVFNAGVGRGHITLLLQVGQQIEDLWQGKCLRDVVHIVLLDEVHLPIPPLGLIWLAVYRICGQCSTLGEARVAVKAARAERELQRRLLLLDVLLEDREEALRHN
jgi:hypothetical protein